MGAMTRHGARTFVLVVALTGCHFWNELDQPGLEVRLSPSDTALYVSDSLMARGAMMNRYGDVYASEHISFLGLDPNVTVTSSGWVIGVSYGRARMVARREQYADTGFVSVVPPGTLAMNSFSSLDVMNVDGSGMSVVTSVGQGLEEAAAWIPGRDSLVFAFGVPGGAGAGNLYVTDLAGHSTLIASNGHDARVTTDRTWVYFTTGGSTIERIHLDGTGRELVVPTTVAHPDPSPDGTQLAFIHVPPPPSSGFEIRIRTLSDSTERVLTADGYRPRWSPDGTHIAFWRSYGSIWGAIYTIDPDGTHLVKVSPDLRNYRATVLDWSPDGQWLVALGEQSLELIQVSGGLVLPLGYAPSYIGAAWRR